MGLVLGIICSYVGFVTTSFTQHQEQGQNIGNSRDDLLKYASSAICLHFGLPLVFELIHLNYFVGKEKSVF